MSPQELLIGSITRKEALNLGSHIVSETSIQAQQKYTFLCLPYMIIELYRCAEVSFNKNKYIKYTDVWMVDITRIKLVDKVKNKKS